MTNNVDKSSRVENDTGAAGRLKPLVRFFRDRRIRKTRELAAYWSARERAWEILCCGHHMSYERDYLVEAGAMRAKYEARLESLLSNNSLSGPAPAPGGGYAGGVGSFQDRKED